MRVVCIWLVAAAFGHSVLGALPCDFLTEFYGNLKTKNNMPVCLGNCPEKKTLNDNGVYIADNQKLYFSNFILETQTENFTLSSLQNTPILTCYANSKAPQCFAGMVPENYPDPLKPSGFYLTGRSGGDPISAFDPWIIKSTIQLDALSTLSQVQLQDTTQGTVTGWRISTQDADYNKYAYTFTNQNQLIVGDVPVSSILANANAQVIAEGPVVVRKGEAGCAVPILRPQADSAVLIYNPDSATDCTSLSSAAFTFTVEIDRCYKSPAAFPDQLFPGDYYKLSQVYRTLYFFSSPNCEGSHSGTHQLQSQICAQGWSAILFPGTIY